MITINITSPDIIGNTPLAERLGISKRTLRTWRQNGLPFYSRGNVIVYSQKEVYAFLDNTGKEQNLYKLLEKG